MGKGSRVYDIVLVRSEEDLGALVEEIHTPLRRDLKELHLHRPPRSALATLVPSLVAVVATEAGGDALKEGGHGVGLAGTGLSLQERRAVAVAVDHSLEQRLEHVVAHALLVSSGTKDLVRPVPVVDHREPSA